MKPLLASGIAGVVVSGGIIVAYTIDDSVPALLALAAVVYNVLYIWGGGLILYDRRQARRAREREAADGEVWELLYATAQADANVDPSNSPRNGDPGTGESTLGD